MSKAQQHAQLVECVKSLDAQLVHVSKRLDMVERVCQMLMTENSHGVREKHDQNGGVMNQTEEPSSSTKRFLRTAF